MTEVHAYAAAAALVIGALWLVVWVWTEHLRGRR